MGPLRVLHQSARDQQDDSELIDYACRARDTKGCLHVEIYRGLEFTENVAIVEVWEDDQNYSAFWNDVVTNQSTNAQVVTRSSASRRYGEDGSEFYAYQQFVREEWNWVPRQQVEQTRISWPGWGPVRIIILNSPRDLDANIPNLVANSPETRREPGCDQFEHFRGVEFPEHSALIEVWSDQLAYDAHWQLRKRAAGGVPRAAGEAGPRRHGENGFEFYRVQRFRQLYGYWVPDDLTYRSETIVWPS